MKNRADKRHPKSKAKAQNDDIQLKVNE